jgi:decaprenylphospho-beta-D-erythro-pentofuranosid-2-ulose 2-reductase
MSKLPDPVLIVGARSDIAVALAHEYAARGCALILAARDPTALATIKADLEVRHDARVTVVACDVTDLDPEPFFVSLEQTPGTVVMVAGLLGDQAANAADAALAEQVMATNFNGPARLLLAAARRMAARGSGAIIGISSVAGDRGRASNFIYGSAKAGFSAFLSGLRNAMAKQGVHVLTVKPGFVATRMTADMDLPPRLTAQPAEVAKAVVRAQERGRDVIYVKPIWGVVMLVIRTIPERIFKRMSI